MQTEIKIKLLNEGAQIPRKAHLSDVAYDLYCPQDTVIPTGRSVVPLGLSMELPEGYAAEVRPRSGFSSQGMADKDGIRRDADVLHGLIDPNFRGEVGVIVSNRDTDFILAKGTRLTLLLIIRAEDTRLVVTESLSDSERGRHGYGSTGI